MRHRRGCHRVGSSMNGRWARDAAGVDVHSACLVFVFSSWFLVSRLIAGFPGLASFRVGGWAGAYGGFGPLIRSFLELFNADVDAVAKERIF